VVQLQFLGSGDAFGSGGRFQACLMLSGAGAPLLVDCGATSLVAMKRAGVDPSTIGAVLISHLHGDHFGGIPFLVLDGQFSRRELPLLIAGPPGVEARVKAAMEVLYPGSSTVERRFPVSYVEWQDRAPATLGDCTVTPYEVDHASGAPAYALRVTYSGRTVAYTGDTAWCESLVDAARGVDLFVAEGYMHSRQVKFHLDVATLMRERPRIECPRIILTHMSNDVLQNEPPGFERAEDGLVVEV
jgi:ribonuclease BN (tRNA processing enzyme)